MRYSITILSSTICKRGSHITILCDVGLLRDVRRAVALVAMSGAVRRPAGQRVQRQADTLDRLRATAAAIWSGGEGVARFAGGGSHPTMNVRVEIL